MTLGTKRDTAVCIAWAWRDEHPLALPVTLEFAFPACEETWHLILMRQILPGKQRSTVWDLKDAFLQPPIGRGESTHLCFKRTGPVRVTAGNIPGPGYPRI